MAIISVTQLNRYVSFRLKEDRTLQSVLVRGEISNFTNHYRSGHFYFTLRDAESSIKAVMFRGNAQRLRFVPQDGMRVIAAATASLYERDGVFQLYVTDLQPEGVGTQAMAFEELKKKLNAMGVFDSAAKQPLPGMPRKIGVVTSDTGAALQDVKNVISRRYPIGQLRIYPALVQGAAAPDSICRGIRAAEQDGCDVLIVGRGGGASEDLQAFNTEQVVLAVYQCTVPVVSAVGHETDWTLTDAAADLRAPTPSAAAELAVPDVRQLSRRVLELARRLRTLLEQRLTAEQQGLQHLCDRLQLQSPVHRQERAQQELETLQKRLEKSGLQCVERYEIQLRRQAERLDMLSPLKILGRGYALAYHGETLVRSAGQVQPGELLRIRLAEGELFAQVQKTERNDL